MRKKLSKLLLLLAVLIVGSGTSWAQEDVTATYLTNADFSIGEAINNNVCTYGKNMAGNNTTYYGAQAISSWTNASTGYTDEGYDNCGMAGALFEYGSTPWLAGSGTPAPATDPNGNAGKAAGLCAVWGQKVQYTQDVTLSAGCYTVRFKVYNATTNNGSGKFITQNLFGFVPNAGTAYYAPNNTFAIGQWSTVAVTFNLTAETAGKISIGYIGAGSGNPDMPHLFVDNVKILKNSDYEDVTNKVGVAQASWTGATDGLQGSTFKTSDGRDARMAAFYGSTAVGEKISQTVTGLAKGTYEAVVFAYSMNEWGNWSASLQNDAGDVGYVMADGKYTIKEWINARKGTHNANDYGIYTLSGIEVDGDGNLKLAYAIDKANQTEWMGIQIKSLIYTGNVTFNADDMQAVYNASGVDGKPMNKDVKTALDAALATAKATPSSTTYVELITAINNAKTSMENYTAAKAVLDAAATLDAAGQAAYAANADIVALQTAYDNRTLTALTSEQKAACEAALRAAAKAQTPVANLDMTLAINNWDFRDCQNGNFPGWRIENLNGNAKIFGDKNTHVEFWTGDPSNGSFDYNQTITNLPTGKYTISGRIWNSKDNGPGDGPNGNAGVYGSVGSTQVFKGITEETSGWGDNLVIKTTDPIIVSDGTLQLGLKNNGTMGARWFGADWVKLTLTEPIPLYNSLAEMIAAAPADPALLKFSNYEVLHQGGDSIVAQVISGGEPLGFVIKGITGVTGAASAVKGTKIAGVIYGSYDAAAHAFTITADPCNAISASAGEATITKMELAEAVDKEKTYQLIKIEMANVVKEGDDFYAKKNADKIKLDKRLFPELMLYDDEMMNSITGVTFVEGDQCVLAPYDQSAMSGNKAEAAVGAAYAQGETVNSVDGVIMTYGGSEDTKKYEFAAATAVVNKLGTVTEGIDQFPVDDEDQAYDKDEENLPTKGTYYVFEPTKDGRLDVTVGLEAKKQLYVTEDGKAIVEKKENADYNGAITFPVEAMKTYYVFANETNLKYYGFSFTPTNAYAKNIVKDIATFKELPTPEVNEGDTLMLKDAVVTYIKSDHVFVEDASGAIDFYQTGIQFYVGQKLNGYIVGKNGELQYLPALFRTDDTKYGNFKITETITPEPTVIDVTEAAMKKNLARFVKLENLMLQKDSRGFKILVDTLTGNNIHVQDHFGVFYELNDTVKSIEGIAGIDADGVYTLWPTSKDGVISSKTIIPEPTLPMPTDGKYYLQNMASGFFWGAGNSWGTQASLLKNPDYITLAKQPDGTYTMESQVSNGGTNYFFNGSFMDQGKAVNLTFTPEMITVENEVALTKDMFKTWTSNVAGAEPTAAQPPFESHFGENSGAGSTLYGNGSVQYLTYADLTGYKKLVADATPGMRLRVLLNRLEVGNGGGDGNGGALTEVFVDINSEGKGELDLTQYDYAHLNAIKIPWGAQAGTVNSLTAVEEVPQAIYTISNGSVMYGYNGTNTIIDEKGVTNAENAKWQIFTEEEMNASLSKATQANPVDATFLILDHTFGRNNRNVSAWKVSNDCTNSDLVGGNSNKHSGESYHSVFTITQTLENVPNGVYALTAQGFYRQDGSDNENLAKVFINDEAEALPLKTGSENSMADACASFEKGLYTMNPMYVKVTDGTINLGLKNPSNTGLWCIWDNFVLTYYGTNANIDELKGGAEMKELQELREKATELSRDEAIEVAAVKTALSNALNQSANVSGSDAIKAAVASLKAAIESAQASKIAKDVLPKMKELVDANNVYTQEAYDQYYGTWIAKYNAGTLTQAEASALQDPTTVTTWHAQITVDNFLLSAWDTNPDFNNAAYYINSWSNEGDNDGTNFHVPFFEYFRPATDGSLEEKTLTATMNGLEAGDYTVNAWVRVALTDKTGDEAYGINMQVNDGTAVDVCDGDMVDSGEFERFFLKEVSANGTVGADGVLTIKFNVASDNNIHWISFKNVKYTKAGAGDETDPNLIEIPQEQQDKEEGIVTLATVEKDEDAHVTTYTTKNNVCVIFKMKNVDVSNCDYILIKFAEPVPDGVCYAFWSNNKNKPLEAGKTELYYPITEDKSVDPETEVVNGIIPEISLITIWQDPGKVVKVTGVYKHLMGVADKIDGITGNLFDDGAIYNLRGQKVEGKLKPGLYIKNGRKVVIK